MPLPHSFYNRDTTLVARELLGMHLVHKEKVARIVETEAYLGSHDLAAHSARGRTPRTEVMFGPPGHAYVYLIYGMYFCFNIVTEREGHASAVLVRAVEPIKNVDAKTSGPGLLCRAMDINLSLNRRDLLSSDFFIAKPRRKEKFEIVARPRIGVDYAGDWAAKPLRFYVAGSPFISRR